MHVSANGGLSLAKGHAWNQDLKRGSEWEDRGPLWQSGDVVMPLAFILLSLGPDAIGLGLFSVAALAALRWSREFGSEG